MLTPPLTAADVGGLFETTDGERAFVYGSPDANGDFLVQIAGGPVRYVTASGKSTSMTLARRLPVADLITERERAVVNAAVAVRLETSVININGLDDAVDALLDARKPRPRRVESVDALGVALATAKLCMTPAQASAVFNALPEVEE